MGWFEKKTVGPQQRLPWFEVLKAPEPTPHQEEPTVESEVRRRLNELQNTLNEAEKAGRDLTDKLSLPSQSHTPTGTLSAAELSHISFTLGLPFRAAKPAAAEPAALAEWPRPTIFEVDDFKEETFGSATGNPPPPPPEKPSAGQQQSNTFKYEYKISATAKNNHFTFGYPLTPPVTEATRADLTDPTNQPLPAQITANHDNPTDDFLTEPAELQATRELEKFFHPLHSREVEDFFKRPDDDFSATITGIEFATEEVSSAEDEICDTQADDASLEKIVQPVAALGNPENFPKSAKSPEETSSLKSDIAPDKKSAVLPARQSGLFARAEKAAADDGDRASVTPRIKLNRQIHIPFNLLHTQKKAFEVADPKETQAIIAKLEETLDQFGIEGRVIGIQRGPIITRYELKMAPGIKVNRILSLTDELAMALEALRVRIEAPIPGRSTVGIEIPNKDRAKVLLGDIVNDPGFREYGGELPLPLGKDIAGNLVLEDLARLPHLLIAGATGSGKSVAVNSFITSLILTKTPEEVRFLLVDPKLVELSHYNDIPHLLHPVITDHQKAILALNWAVEEMERRYEDLAEMRVRDIRSYNAKLTALRESHKIDYDIHPPMPYIVVLIDELGDLMMVAGKEVEASIIRLAQKARAVGIHLILATQRPSVDVITALIKANCPARIALQVAQKTDSRTILDSNGAEQLVGQGDLLFKHPNRGQLVRVQAPLVLDDEVESVVNQAKKMGKAEYITLEDPKASGGNLEPEEEQMFDEAWQIIVESGKASASYLQRRLRIGYNRAARLIEAFEARGMIGPQVGSKPREILGR